MSRDILFRFLNPPHSNTSKQHKKVAKENYSTRQKNNTSTMADVPPVHAEKMLCRPHVRGVSRVTGRPTSQTDSTVASVVQCRPASCSTDSQPVTESQCRAMQTHTLLRTDKCRVVYTRTAFTDLTVSCRTDTHTQTDGPVSGHADTHVITDGPACRHACRYGGISVVPCGHTRRCRRT